jgi:hypothetical protein
VSAAGGTPSSGGNSIDDLRRAIAVLEGLDEATRERVFAPFAADTYDGLRHMVVADELNQLAQGGVCIGLHGKTHTPMPRAVDRCRTRRRARSSPRIWIGHRSAHECSARSLHARDRATAHDAGYELSHVTDDSGRRRPLAARSHCRASGHRHQQAGSVPTSSPCAVRKPQRQLAA